MKESIYENDCRALNIFLTALFVIALVLFIITSSIGLPIYFRFFYYIQIKTLGLEEKTGYDYQTIKRAYDDILNFCTMSGFPAATGDLKLSASGASHFADCKKLFNLNLFGIIFGGGYSLAIYILHRLKVITLCRPLGHSASFLAALTAVALPVIIALLILIVGFDEAFEAFHHIFFPGKSNWLFNPETDQIINVMPEEFFFNCAVIIACGLVAYSAGFITADLVGIRRVKKAVKG